MPTKPKAKILIVDGMNASRRLLARHLAHHGYQVIEAPDPAMGREMAVVNLPDLVITDVRFNGTEGVSLIQALRSVSALDATPILIASPVEDDATVVAALHAGANDYVVKPVAFSVLKARVATQLRGKAILDEIKRRRSESEMLLATLHEVTESSSLEEVLFRLTQRLGRLMTASRCSIITVSERRRTGIIAASMEDPRARGVHLDLSRYPEIIEAVHSKSAVVVDDESHPELRAELGEVFRIKQLASILTVPVTFRDEILGVLTMHVREGEPALTDDHVQFVKLVACAIGGIVRTAGRLEGLAPAAPERPKLTVVASAA